MNVFQNIWSDLVEKKLWPVALLLIALIVAVPVMLSKPGDSAGAATPPLPAVDTAEGPQLALTRASTTGFARPPRVNDERLDPFAARISDAQLRKMKAVLTKAVNDILNGEGGGGGGETPGGGDLPGGTPPADPTPTSPEPNTKPKVKTEQDDLLSILVSAPASAGAESEPVQVNDIRTFTPLVDTDDPFLVYVGKTSTGGATFLVSADVTVSGDGVCAPTQADCRTLTLEVSETAEFTRIKDPKDKTSVTVLEVETKHVPILDDASAAAGTDTDAGLDSGADLDPAETLIRAAEARRAGATALKSVLTDDEVVKALKANKVKIRR